jgi:hypothetical protein
MFSTVSKENFQMIKKNLMIMGLLILLTSCGLNTHPVKRMTDYKDPKSELIKALITEAEISNISSDFSWDEIIFTQNQYPDPGTTSAYENVQGSFFGNFQNSDQAVMLFHTINKYNSLLDKNKPTVFLLSGYDDAPNYIPDISASGVMAAKCVVITKEAKQICDIHVKYNYIESAINITTYNIGKEETSKWLNAMVSAVEPQIMAQDLSK